MMISNSEKRCNYTSQHYDIMSKIQACRKKARSMVRRLKCSRKKVLLHRNLRGDCSRLVFTESILLRSPERTVNRVSAIK